MEKKFEFLEHTADIKFRAYGKSLEECFENAALAMFSVMTKIEKVEGKEKAEIKCSASNIEELLIEWLNSLLAESGIKEMFFSSFKIKKIKNNSLEGEAFGEKIDLKKHEIITEVKAATYSDLFVKKEKEIYICQVVVDV